MYMYVCFVGVKSNVGVNLYVRFSFGMFENEENIKIKFRCMFKKVYCINMWIVIIGVFYKLIEWGKFYCIKI